MGPITYDELSLPKWIARQLLKIDHIKDHEAARHALVQTIQSMWDATSMPWEKDKSDKNMFKIDIAPALPHLRVDPADAFKLYFCRQPMI